MVDFPFWGKTKIEKVCNTSYRLASITKKSFGNNGNHSKTWHTIDEGVAFLQL